MGKPVILNLEQHNIGCSTARAQYQLFSTIPIITCSHIMTCSRPIREQDLSIKSNNVKYITDPFNDLLLIWF